MDDLLFDEIDMMFSQSIENEKKISENKQEVIVDKIEEVKNVEEEFISKAIYLLNNEFKLESIIEYLNQNKILLRNLNDNNSKYKKEANVIILMFFHRVLDFLNIDFEIIVGEKEQNNLKKLTKSLLHDVLDFSIFDKFNFCDQKSSNTCKTNAFTLMLKFKDVKISNSSKLEHIMPQINFLLPISCNYNLHNYNGEYCNIIRPIVTKNELYSSYNFSHSNGDCYSLNANLCYGGSDTQINKKINEFFNFFNPTSVYKESKFEAFIEIFLTIDSYVRWESLEGTPYKYIKNIVKSNNKFFNDDYSHTIDKTCFDFIINLFNISNELNKNSIKETLSISLESDLLNNDIINVEIINEEFYNNLISSLYTTAVDNEGIVRYVDITSSSNNINIQSKYLYTDLKGNDIYITLKNDEIEQVNEKRITKRLKLLIENKIKYYFNKKLYDKYIKKIEKC